MKKLICILLATTTLQAALPPLAQSIREIEKILADPVFYQKLGSSETIEEILKTQDGYTINTRSRSILVKIHYLPNQQPGPARFEIEFIDCDSE